MRRGFGRGGFGEGAAQRLEELRQLVAEDLFVNAVGVRLLLGGAARPAFDERGGVALEGAADFEVLLGPQHLGVDGHARCLCAVASSKSSQVIPPL